MNNRRKLGTTTAAALVPPHEPPLESDNDDDSVSEIAVDSPETQRQLIRDWLETEKRTQDLKRTLATTKVTHKALMRRIVANMKSSSVDKYSLGGNNGDLIRHERRRPQGISKRYLLAELNKYYAEDPKEAERVSEYLLAHRRKVIDDTLELKASA